MRTKAAFTIQIISKWGIVNLNSQNLWSIFVNNEGVCIRFAGLDRDVVLFESDDAEVEQNCLMGLCSALTVPHSNDVEFFRIQINPVGLVQAEGYRKQTPEAKAPTYTKKKSTGKPKPKLPPTKDELTHADDDWT